MQPLKNEESVSSIPPKKSLKTSSSQPTACSKGHAGKMMNQVESSMALLQVDQQVSIKKQC